MVTKRYFAEQWTENNGTLLDLAQQLFRFFLTDESGQALLSLLHIHTASCVIDTNVLLQDMSRTLKKQQISALILAARIGTLTIYATTQVRDEVLEKLATRAQSLKIDEQEARQLWQTTYLPLLHFLDPADLVRENEKITALLLRDPDDVPTAQLVELLRPTIFFSEDQDLSAFSLTAAPWTQLTCAYRDHGERDAKLITLALGGGFALQISLGALRLLITLLTRIHPRWFFVAAIVLGVSLIIPQTRHLMMCGVQTLSRRLQEMDLGEQVQDLMDMLSAMAGEAQEARSFLKQQEGPGTVPASAFEYLLQVLSLSGTALTPIEISQRMVARGYKPRGAHPERYVAQLLRSYPQLFTLQQNRRWQMASLMN